MAADGSRLPYGFSWWLDAVTEQRWDALVLDDYRVVFPLPVVRSFGRFTQVSRAAFTQQGGPYGQLEPGDLTALLTNLPRSVLRFRPTLSAGVQATDIPERYSVKKRTNLTLDLSPDYPTLLQAFSKTLRKKLRRYPEPALQQADISTVIDVYRTSSGEKAGLSPAHYQIVRRLMEASRAQGIGELYRLDGEQGLLATGFFPTYQGRIVNLFAGSTPLGFSEDGMARLLAAVMQQLRGEGNIFDFEGSDIPGVRSFFASFGATNDPYYGVKRKGLF